MARALDTWLILNKINKLKTSKISDSLNLGLVLGNGGRAEVERRVVSISLENPIFKFISKYARMGRCTLHKRILLLFNHR